MVNVESEANALFDRYLDCWNARNLPGVAACFAEPSMFVVPTGAIALPDRAALVTVLEKIFAGLDAAGFSHTTIGSITTTACNDTVAVVDAEAVQRHKTDGSLLEEIDGHYIMQKAGEGWLFTTAVVCTPGWRKSR